MAQAQRQPYQHLSYLVSTTRNDPGLLILSSRQLLKHVCRAINNKASHDKDKTQSIIVVIFPWTILTGHCDQLLHRKGLFTTRHVHGGDRLHILDDKQSRGEEANVRYDKMQNV